MMDVWSRAQLAWFALFLISATPKPADLTATNANLDKGQKNPVVKSQVVDWQTSSSLRDVRASKSCKAGHYDRESDLCAQWVTADASVESARWTFWGVVMGVIGTIGLFWTLYYTRKAVRAAERSSDDATHALRIAERNADAASRQADIAEDTARRQLRAYISLDNAHISELITGYTVKTRIAPKNSGQTPAISFVGVSAVYVGPTGKPLPRPPEIDLNAFGGTDIGAGGTFEMNGVSVGIIDDNMMKALMSKNQTIYVIARYQYSDIFDALHTGEIILESCDAGRETTLRVSTVQTLAAK